MDKKYFDCKFKQESLSEEGIFEGYASDYIDKKDSYGDIIVKGAFTKTLQNGGRNGNGIAMLWSHNSDKPIGVWQSITDEGNRLKAIGQLAMKTQLGKETYELMKIGAVKGLSIGYDISRDEDGKALEDAYEFDSKKKIRYLKQLDLWEISPVVFPANIRATITSVKDVEDIEQKAQGNIREFERLLREEGCSNQLAKIIAGNWNRKNNKNTEFLNKLLNTVKEIRYSMKPDPSSGESEK